MNHATYITARAVRHWLYQDATPAPAPEPASPWPALATDYDALRDELKDMRDRLLSLKARTSRAYADAGNANNGPVFDASLCADNIKTAITRLHDLGTNILLEGAALSAAGNDVEYFEAMDRVMTERA